MTPVASEDAERLDLSYNYWYDCKMLVTLEEFVTYLQN